MHRLMITIGVATLASGSVAQVSDPIQGYALGRRLSDVAQRCNALSAVEAAALKTSTDQLMEDLPADRRAAAQVAATAAGNETRGIGCATPQGQALVTQARQVATRQAILWLARAGATGVLAQGSPWANQSAALTAAYPRLALIRGMFDRRDPAVASQARMLAARDAQLTATVLCAAASPRPAGCPATQVPAPTAVARARGYLQRLEAFAKVATASAASKETVTATANGARSVAAPVLPPGAKAWSDVLAVRPGLTDLEAGSSMMGVSMAVKCAPGDLVVVLDGPAPAAPLAPAAKGRAYRLSATGAIAPVSVIRSPFLLQILSPPAALTGVTSNNSLRPCLAP